MNKKPTFSPSLPQEPIRVRVLREIPVLPELQPVVGKVYDAIKGTKPQPRGRPYSCDFCVIEVDGNPLILRRKQGEEPEFEEVKETEEGKEE